MSVLWLHIVAASAIMHGVYAYGVFKSSEEDDGSLCCSGYSPIPSGMNVTDDTCVIGPPCTMDVHNDYADCGCPGQAQPSAGPFINGTDFLNHSYEDHFVMDFKIYFFDSDEYPPSIPGENVTHTVGYGRSFYDVDVGGGFMRESYYNRCLPIFPAPPLMANNNYSCDFYTLNNNNTAYMVLHDDKPEGAPDCCVIGNPFRCPPQDFFQNLPIKRQSIEPFNNAVEPGSEGPNDTQVIDWSTVNVTGMKEVLYGFVNDYDGSQSVPFAFLFRGGPWIKNANWCYQRFYKFNSTRPSPDEYSVPSSCSQDDVTWCPGWEPWEMSTSCQHDTCPQSSGGNAEVFYVRFAVFPLLYLSDFW